MRKKSFEVIDASYYNWSPGINSGERGINYSILLKIEKNKLSFDSVWINESAFPIELEKGKGRNDIKSIVKQDTITLAFTEIFAEKISESSNAMNKKTIAPPMAYDGKALIRYYVGNKKKYFTIKEFRKTPSPRYK